MRNAAYLEEVTMVKTVWTMSVQAENEGHYGNGCRQFVVGDVVGKSESDQESRPE